MSETRCDVDSCALRRCSGRARLKLKVRLWSGSQQPLLKDALILSTGS